MSPDEQDPGPLQGSCILCNSQIYERDLKFDVERNSCLAHFKKLDDKWTEKQGSNRPPPLTTPVEEEEPEAPLACSLRLSCLLRLWEASPASGLRLWLLLSRPT